MSTQQASMNVSLPETMRRWVEQRVESEGYGTVSEYFRALIREDQKRKAREELDRKLIEALDSGEPTELTSQDWQHIRSTVRQRVARRARKG